MRNCIALAAIVMVGTVLVAQQAVAPPASFADPQRRAKLATAICRRRQDSRRLCQVGPRARRRLGHHHRRRARASRRDGRARRRREGAGRRRHGVPHRVDDQELHGDVDPQAARRGQAVARRSGRDSTCPEMAGAASTRRRTRRGSPSAICCRTPRDFPRTTRGAISSSPRPTTELSRMHARAAFRSRTRPASPTSTRTTASRFSAASCRACRACRTTSTSPRTS